MLAIVAAAGALPADIGVGVYSGGPRLMAPVYWASLWYYAAANGYTLRAAPGASRPLSANVC